MKGKTMSKKQGSYSYYSVFILSMIITGLVYCRSTTAGQWIDLTHDFSSETVYWPNGDTFKKDLIYDGETEKGYYYSAYSFCAPEHGGTHIDAPVHFAKGRRSVDQIPIDQLLGDAIMVDVSKQALKNVDYLITVDDLKKWEAQHGKIQDLSIILLKTGYGQFWPNLKKYMGTDKRGKAALSELHFPGLHPDTAKWLVKERRIKSIGIDTASIDNGQSSHFGSHRILSGNDVPIFENVANLDQLPATGIFLIALPMKIKGGSGAPLRIVALISGD